MTTTPSQNDLTRQQLEELDLLLQRMLSAPSAKPEAKKSVPVIPDVPVPTPASVEGWRIDPPAPMPPRLHSAPMEPIPLDAGISPIAQPKPVTAFVPPEPPEEPKAPVVSQTLIELPAQTTVPVTPAVPFQPAPSESLPAFGRLDPVVFQASEPAPVSTPPVDTSTAPGVPMVMWPLYGVNWMAEECLKLFGGESLTRPTAKWALGVAGIAMLVGAAAWTLHGTGIVTFTAR